MMAAAPPDPERACDRAQSASIDLGAVTDSVLRSFGGQVPRERIELLLSQLLDQEFSQARVTTFLPIFLHRVACESLRREAEHVARLSR